MSVTVSTAAVYRFHTEHVTLSSIWGHDLDLTLIQPASKWMHLATLDAILICFELPPPLPPRTSLKPWNLSVQCLSRYVLVIHSYHMSKPSESSFTEYVVHWMQVQILPYQWAMTLTSNLSLALIYLTSQQLGT